MNILCCLKVAPESQDIQVDSSGELILDKGDWKIGEYDLPAIESGRLLHLAQEGSTFSGITLGDGHLEGSKLKKEILSRGMTDLYAIIDEGAYAFDSYQTASVLAAAVKKRGEFDVIFCGTGSADMYSQSVGNQLGALLDVPAIDYVRHVEINGSTATVQRQVDGGEETLEVTLPAVFTVTPDIEEPKIPGMKDILGANKKPMEKWSLSDLAITVPARNTEIISTLAPQYKERKQIVKEASDEAIVEFANMIKNSL